MSKWMGRSRIAQGLAAAAALVSLSTACGDDTGASGSVGPPAGNPIVDGIDVPPGTELLGDVFAHRVPAEESDVAPPPVTTLGPSDHGAQQPPDQPTPSGESGMPPAQLQGPEPTAPPAPTEPEPTDPPRELTVKIVPASPTPAYVEVKAVLLVTGDPIEAFASLLEQAEAAGMSMRTYTFEDDNPAFCRVTEAEADPQRAAQVYALEDDLPDGDLELGCDASGRSDAEGDSQRELDVTLSVSERAEPFQSFLTVTYRSYQPTGVPVMSVLWKAGAYASAPVPPGPSPVTPPKLPDEGLPGDPLTADWEWGYDGADYQVLDGSRQPAPAMPVTSATGGFVTVIEVTGDVEPMIDRYFDQISGLERSEDESFEYDGAAMRYVACDCGGGGGSFTISATQRPGEPGYLLIERHTD